MGTIISQKTATTNTSGGGSVMGSFAYPRNGIVKIDYESILLFKKSSDDISPKISNKSKRNQD